ncbi:MAG TPA: tetratricopeptide repeat-containing diguanylate cyclase [Rudaea sp.]|nr:tetratricopeptide repeat-containing diguanylate cyclase [Rudaea sp.]
MHGIRDWAPWFVATAIVFCGSVLAVEQEPPLPSATAFDALLKRIEYGDLGELDPARQREYVDELKALLPAHDAHRQRLLDSVHCSLDFPNANKEGYAFADAKLAEALLAADDVAAIRFYYCRGSYQQALTSARDALADFERGIDLARIRGDDALLATGLEIRGGTQSLLGVHGKALADLLEAQRIFQRNELETAADGTLQSIGIAYRRLGYPEKAREYLNHSIEHEQRVGDHESLFASVIQLGYIEQETGHADKALATDQRALEIATSLGERASIGSANLAIAGVYNDAGRHREALIALQKAEQDFAATADAADEGMVQFERGRALTGLGQAHKALENFSRAEAAFDASGNTRYQEMLHKAKAAALEADGQAAAALAEFKRYLSVHDEVERLRADEQAQMLRAQFDSERANLENARLKAEQALKDRQVQSLLRVRQWQQIAMTLLAMVLGFLALLVLRQVRKLRRWKRMASIDPLTGVANRRGIEQFVAHAMRQARSRREALAVLALDLDRFKLINDSYGHAAGDRVLQHIARNLREGLRDDDLLGRMGGEEFLVVLPGSTLEQASDIAERLRSRIESLDLDDLPAGLRTTVSIGVAEMTAQDSSFGDLEKRADEALYRAKAEGRNRVVGAFGQSANQDFGAPAGAASATGGGFAS